MKTMNVLRLFLASPGDVKPEREMVFALKDDLDILIGKHQNIKFEIVNWERNTYPGIGDDAQAVINKQIKGDFDVFIGIFWQRFGTPTNRYESGTLEEYENAKLKFANNGEDIPIMMYFKTQEVDMYKVDIPQFQQVKLFREKISSEDGVLYATFEKTDDLKNLLQIHLSNLVADMFNKQNDAQNEEKTPTIEPVVENLDKYELLAKKIEENDSNLEIENLIDEIAATESFLLDLTNCTKKITLTMNFFSEKTQEKTSQLVRLKTIKDEKFKLSRIKKISNQYSSDLDSFSQDFETILPEFRDTIDSTVQSYTEIIFKTINSAIIGIEDKREFLANLPRLIKSIEGAIEGVAKFLESFVELNISPTLKFSTAKRRAELASNNIFKELIRTKKLLQELHDNNLI